MSLSSWSTVTACEEFRNFKADWIPLAKDSKLREAAARCIKESYEASRYANLDDNFFRAPLGRVKFVAAEFSLWMRGVAIIAAYLSEKKQLEGLYVCLTLEALARELNKIAKSDTHQRCAFVVPCVQSGGKSLFGGGFEPNFPQHKSTVCVEKLDGKMTIALLDAAPWEKFNKEIIPEHLSEDIWDGYATRGSFNCQELVFRAILLGCKGVDTSVRFLHSQVEREKGDGCEVFALMDAIAFLNDPQFFDKITCSKTATVIDENRTIEVITDLPPEFMKGTQSYTLIEKYGERSKSFDQTLFNRKRTLQEHFDAYSLMVEHPENPGIFKKENHYITRVFFKYLKFVELIVRTKTDEELEEIIAKTLIC